MGPLAVGGWMTCFSDRTLCVGCEPDAPGPGPDREARAECDGAHCYSLNIGSGACSTAVWRLGGCGGCAGGPRPQPWPSSQHSQASFSLNGLKNPLRLLGGELKGFYFICRNTSDFCLHIILNLKLVTKRMRIVHCGVFRSKYGHLLR